MIEDLDIRISGDFLRQEWFDVLSVDPDIMPAAGGVGTIRVFLDHQPHFFQVLHGIMKAFGHCQDQIIPDDLLRVPADKRQIILRSLPFSQPGIERVYAGGQTAGALNICLFCHQDLCSRRFPGSCDRRIASGSTAPYDQDVCRQQFLFHILTPLNVSWGRFQ